MKHKTYLDNPSIDQAKKNTILGNKIQYANQEKTITTEIYTNSEDDDVRIEKINFHTRKVVDKDQFIMLYISAFPALSNLTKSAKILYQYVLVKVNKEIGKDKILMNYKEYSMMVEKNGLIGISQATYYRALDELLTSEILFQSAITNQYFINIAYFFNGNRLRFIQDYDLMKSEQLKENDNEN